MVTNEEDCIESESAAEFVNKISSQDSAGRIRERRLH